MSPPLRLRLISPLGMEEAVSAGTFLPPEPTPRLVTTRLSRIHNAHRMQSIAGPRTWDRRWALMQHLRRQTKLPLPGLAFWAMQARPESLVEPVPAPITETGLGVYISTTAGPPEAMRRPPLTADGA